jgi:hypothetical protein
MKARDQKEGSLNKCRTELPSSAYTACTSGPGVLLGKRGWRSSVELSSSLPETILSDSDATPHCDVGMRRVKAPIRWVIPVAKAKKIMKWVTFKPVVGSVKYLDAKRERKSGDNPKNVMLAPDAAPGYWGKVLDAAKRDEK